jgi:chromosomal replication initiation ATPase DnaA
VSSAFEGYNACVFAYGQTGSGKTFTMMGSAVSNKKNCMLINNKIYNLTTTKQFTFFSRNVKA